MSRPWIVVSRRVAASPSVDVVIAAGFLVAAEVELWSLPTHPPTVAARLAVIGVGAAVTAPLAWRRRAPLVAISLIAVGLAAAEVAARHVSDLHGQGPFVPFGAVLLAAFSFGAYGTASRALPAVILGVALASRAAVQMVYGTPDLATWAVGILFWALGRLYRRRLLQVSVLEGESSRLRIEREEVTRAAIAEERTRIARELHDVVAHSVSVMMVQAGAARHTLDSTDTEMADTLEAIETTGREALVELRRMLGILRRSDDLPALAPVPNLAQLDGLIAQMRDAGLPAVLRVEGASMPLPAGVDLAAYRIVQESLTNSLKHARPTAVEVIVRYRRHHVEVEVIDDGPSTDQAANDTGHGLIGMRERVCLYGGTLDAGPEHQGGYAVRARLPLETTNP